MSNISNLKATLHRANHFPKEDFDKLQEIHNKYYRKVAELFCTHKTELSPTRVHQHFYPGFPRVREGREHTSTRRAITDLTKDGYLVKTETVVDSLLGGKEHTWIWKGKPEQVELFESEGFSL